MAGARYRVSLPSTFTFTNASPLERATMRSVAGDPYMHDPTLLDRLGTIKIPVQVIWGDNDRIVSPTYGAVYAAAFADARLDIVRDAGHLPQIEQPTATFALIDRYVTDEADQTTSDRS